MLPLLVASDGLRIVGFESERVWKSCQRCESCTALEWCSSAIRCWNLFAVKDVQFFFFIFPLLLPPTIGAISVLSPKRLPTKFLISRAYATASSFLIICLALTIFNSYVAVGCERLFLPLNRRCNSYLPSRRDKLLYSVNEFISPIRFAVTRDDDCCFSVESLIVPLVSTWGHSRPLISIPSSSSFVGQNIVVLSPPPLPPLGTLMMVFREWIPVWRGPWE